MLRVNVATRPFYNERGVHLVLAAVAALLIGLGVFNAYALSRLTEREQVLGGQIASQEAKARDLRQDAAKVRGSIREDELQAVLVAAREANGLIDRRTFSWTQLFNYLEATLPDDVMLTTVRPLVEGDKVTVTLGVIGRRVAAIDEFMTRLEGTRAFNDVLSRDEQALEDGGFEAALVGTYEPGEATPASASAPATPVPTTAAASPAPAEAPGGRR